LFASALGGEQRLELDRLHVGGARASGSKAFRAGRVEERDDVAASTGTPSKAWRSSTDHLSPLPMMPMRQERDAAGDQRRDVDAVQRARSRDRDLCARDPILSVTGCPAHCARPP
jgi:hypothetical protein